MKNFSIEEELFLLTVVKGNGNVIPLTETHTYDEIVSKIKEMLNEEILVNEDSLRVTEKGEEYMVSLLKKQKKLKRDWIQPYFQFRCERIDEKFIYLPHRIDNL